MTLHGCHSPTLVLRCTILDFQMEWNMVYCKIHQLWYNKKYMLWLNEKHWYCRKCLKNAQNINHVTTYKCNPISNLTCGCLIYCISAIEVWYRLFNSLIHGSDAVVCDFEFVVMRCFNMVNWWRMSKTQKMCYHQNPYPFCFTRICHAHLNSLPSIVMQVEALKTQESYQMT